MTGEEIDLSRMQEVVEQADGSLVPIPPFRFFQQQEEQRRKAQKLEEQMDTVLHKIGPNGTHSILDISELITDSQYYGALLLPEEILQQFFTETKPTRAVVEALVSHEAI